MQTFGEINGVPIAFTKHALTRMVEMELTAEEIKALILEPEDIYTSKKFPGEVSHRKGRHSMAFCRDEENGRYVVKTVLYSSKEEWAKAAKEGLIGDRETGRVNPCLEERSRANQRL